MTLLMLRIWTTSSVPWVIRARTLKSWLAKWMPFNNRSRSWEKWLVKWWSKSFEQRLNHSRIVTDLWLKFRMLAWSRERSRYVVSVCEKIMEDEVAAPPKLNWGLCEWKEDEQSLGDDDDWGMIGWRFGGDTGTISWGGERGVEVFLVFFTEICSQWRDSFGTETFLYCLVVISGLWWDNFWFTTDLIFRRRFCFHIPCTSKELFAAESTEICSRL